MKFQSKRRLKNRLDPTTAHRKALPPLRGEARGSRTLLSLDLGRRIRRSVGVDLSKRGARSKRRRDILDRRQRAQLSMRLGRRHSRQVFGARRMPKSTGLLRARPHIRGDWCMTRLFGGGPWCKLVLVNVLRKGTGSSVGGARRHSRFAGLLLLWWSRLGKTREGE